MGVSTMLDRLFWTTVRVRPVWGSDGYLEWVIFERHRLTGTYRTSHVREQFLHASEFGSFSPGDQS